MELNGPCIITPRLLAGIKIGNSYVSIDYAKRPADQPQKTRYRYDLDLEDGRHYGGDDLQTPRHSLQDALAGLLDFLSTAVETYSYWKMVAHDDWDAEDSSFPEWVVEWAYQHEDDLIEMHETLEQDGPYIEE